jgi:hypothetical protein
VRRLPAIVGALLAPTLATSPTWAGDSPGYAFDNPRLLTQQLLWGRVHGIRLLALACQDRGDAPAALAYADWLDRQSPRIRLAERDLAHHYFDRDHAGVEAIDAALGLKPQLETPGAEIAAACATLPAALAEPRNDLEHIYNERRQAILRGDPQFPGAVWQEAE